MALKKQFISKEFPSTIATSKCGALREIKQICRLAFHIQQTLNQKNLTVKHIIVSMFLMVIIRSNKHTNI